MKKFVGVEIEKKELLYLIGLTIIGLSARVFEIYHLKLIPVDALDYIALSKYFLGAGNIEKVTLIPREPLISIIMAPFLYIFGFDFIVMRWVTAVFDVINIWMLWILTKTFISSRKLSVNSSKAAIFVSIIYTFNNRIVAQATYGIREQIYLFMLIVILLISYSKVFTSRKKILILITSILITTLKLEALVVLIGFAIIWIYIEKIILNKNLFIRQTPAFFIIIGTLLGYLISGIIYMIIFGNFNATTTWQANGFYKHEFGQPPSTSLTPFTYLLNFHTIPTLFKAYFGGLTELITFYFFIYSFILFSFWGMGFLRVLNKNYHELVWFSVYPLFFIGIFAYLWGFSGYMRHLIPYASLSLIFIVIEALDFINESEIKISKQKTFIVTKNAWLALIFTIVSFYYLLRIITS